MGRQTSELNNAAEIAAVIALDMDAVIVLTHGAAREYARKVARAAGMLAEIICTWATVGGVPPSQLRLPVG